MDKNILLQNGYRRFHQPDNEPTLYQKMGFKSKVREITVDWLTLTVGCRKHTERGCFTFICGKKSKAGNYMYCSTCLSNKIRLDKMRNEQEKKA